MIIPINLNELTSFSSLASSLEEIFFSISSAEAVTIQINLNVENLIFSDSLLLLSSAIRYLRDNNKAFAIEFVDFDPYSSKTQYASRVDFFRLIGYEFPEDFNRRDSTGRFIEITPFNAENSIELHQKVMRILLHDQLNEEMLAVLNFCLWEVIDNTLNHADTSFKYGASGGWLSCQYFPNNRKIRLMIADTGQGIHRALTTHPASLYKHLNEAEAVLQSIEKGVTNGNGKGFGLWATSQMLQQNKGRLIIHSGNSMLRCKSGIDVVSVPFWKGTYTFLEINTQIPVNYDMIFPDRSQFDDFNELKDSLVVQVKNLW